MFKRKERNERDFGLIAEKVAALEPLLVTRNHKGEIEGVKYDQIDLDRRVRWESKSAADT